MPRIPEKKKRVWPIILLILLGILLIAGAWMLIDHLQYKNRKQSYDYYNAHPEIYQAVADEVLAKAAEKSVTEMYISSQAESHTYGGLIVYGYIDSENGKEMVQIYNSYEDLFSKDVAKYISRIFRKTIAKTIMFVIDENGDYRVDFVEEMNERRMNMTLSYMRNPAGKGLSDEMKQYYLDHLYKLHYAFNENWFYVQRLA